MIIIDHKLENLVEEMKKCEMCSLSKYRNSVVTGRGCTSPKLLFCGEAPGADEDKQGLPFVGRSGKLLDLWIEYLKLNKADYAITNLIMCRPPANRNPNKDEIQSCSTWTDKKLDLLNPKVIITIGKFSSVYFLGKKFESGILSYSGKFYKNQDRRLIYPVVHPSYYLRHGAVEPNEKYDWREQLKTLKIYLNNG